jgi:hypothetical protein
MEGYIYTRKRDGCESTLKLDVTLCSLLLLGALEAFQHNVPKHLLDLLNSELLSQL